MGNYVCPHCGGSGKFLSMNGVSLTGKNCPVCGGKGKFDSFGEYLQTPGCILGVLVTLVAIAVLAFSFIKT